MFIRLAANKAVRRRGTAAGKNHERGKLFHKILGMYDTTGCSPLTVTELKKINIYICILNVYMSLLLPDFILK